MGKRGRVRMELIGGKDLQQKLRALGSSVQAANNTAARAAQTPILNEASANAPGPHVMALQSPRESTEDLAVVNIGPDKDHWYYQFAETGAGAHEIKAKSKALAFEGRKGLVIVKSIQHPGRSARPFLRPAMAHNREAAQKLAGEVFLAEINRIANGAD